MPMQEEQQNLIKTIQGKPGRKLRTGVILPDGEIPAWVASSLEQVGDIAGLDICAFLVNKREQAESRWFSQYLQLDRKAFHPANPAWKAAVFSLPAGIPVVKLEDPGQVASYRLDVLLNFALTEMPGWLFEAADLGIITASENGVPVVTGSQPGWVALMHGDPVTKLKVQIIGKTDEPVDLLDATFSNDLISLSRQQSRLYWNTADLLPAALRYLVAGKCVCGDPEPIKRKAISPALWRLPVIAGQQLIQLAKRQVQVAGRKLRKFLPFEQWVLWSAQGNGQQLPDWKDFKPLLPPRDRYWADPFLVRNHGVDYLFYEEYPYSTRCGRINCCEISPAGKMTNPRTVLERPYHLSYPFVFNYSGNWYMIPETGENLGIELYRCNNFPDEWVFEKTIMPSVRAADTTLVEQDGTWWMFTSINQHAGVPNSHGLYLFHAQNPTSGTWSPHPLNPVVRDVHSARPAGAFFTHEGKLIRPSQDCSLRYGYGLVLNRVDKLTQSEYSETCIGRLQPAGGSSARAVHTYTMAGGLVMIDGIISRKVR